MDDDDNGTAVIEFILLGFSGLGTYQVPLFWGVLFVYLVTLLGNSLIITLLDSALSTPMYFFLRHLSLIEILYTTTIVPRMLNDLLSSHPVIYLSASCFTQMYFFALFGIAECCLLTAMAYDHFAAICRPLHYATLMNRQVCVGMVGASYLLGITSGTTDAIFIFTLHFHGSNIVYSFFCDDLPVLRLASGDTFQGEVGNFVVTLLFIITPFVLIVFSYVRILITILGLASAQGRQKFFSTCSSHLLVVTLFYGTATIAYIKPGANIIQNMDQILSLFYTVVTPMFNPFIYTLRNKEVMGALKRTVNKTSLKSLTGPVVCLASLLIS
ncbi:LOW QUALITY PROTEIN: olfactory receptor 9-like [Gracilinanus agilis]|uniref:LOW QUALITY PROTEIN: olfactory receptor 9-like n=1 Tax=Gracilinanus agilis TaxID=191870 RepID=UPI001CFD22A8|nr:LOW QUALITY PROTEIN: olfactory receptor 9-like [Gracilinanus agilis]